MPRNSSKKRGLGAAALKTRKRVAKTGGDAMAKIHKNDNFFEMIGEKGGETTAQEYEGTGFYTVIGHQGGLAKGKRKAKSQKRDENNGQNENLENGDLLIIEKLKERL